MIHIKKWLALGLFVSSVPATAVTEESFFYRMAGAPCVASNDDDLRQFLTEGNCSLKASKTKPLREIARNLYYDILFQERVRDLTCQMNIIDSYDVRKDDLAEHHKVVEGLKSFTEKHLSTNRIKEISIKDYISSTDIHDAKEKQKLMVYDIAEKLELMSKIEEAQRPIQDRLTIENDTKALLAQLQFLKELSLKIKSKIFDISNPNLENYVLSFLSFGYEPNFVPFDKQKFIQEALSENGPNSFQRKVIVKTKEHIGDQLKGKYTQALSRKGAGSYPDDFMEEVFETNFHRDVMKPPPENSKATPEQQAEYTRLTNALYDLNCSFKKQDYKVPQLKRKTVEYTVFIFVPGALTLRGVQLVRLGLGAKKFFAVAGAISTVQLPYSLARRTPDKDIEINKRLCNQEIVGAQNVGLLKSQLSETKSELDKELQAACSDPMAKLIASLCKSR